jgi:hypothetical protein
MHISTKPVENEEIHLLIGFSFLSYVTENVENQDARLDSAGVTSARDRRVEGVEKVILCYTDAIEMNF